MPAALELTARMALVETTARRAGAPALVHFHVRDRLAFEIKRHSRDFAAAADRPMKQPIRAAIYEDVPEDALICHPYRVSRSLYGSAERRPVPWQPERRLLTARYVSLAPAAKIGSTPNLHLAAAATGGTLSNQNASCFPSAPSETIVDTMASTFGEHDECVMKLPG